MGCQQEKLGIKCLFVEASITTTGVKKTNICGNKPKVIFYTVFLPIYIFCFQKDFKKLSV